MQLSRSNILKWLRDEDPTRLVNLWQEADELRRARVGDEVHLRGLVEISNYCVRRCHYCGIRAERSSLTRYRMTVDEILQAARLAMEFGYGTVVLQAGEDPGLTEPMVAEVIQRIRGETELAVTLSLGERAEAELARWREVGADRYLLRFETSNRALYDRIHPARPGGVEHRLELLRVLGRIGYELGSGVMIGIPGQTYEDLARDIELFADLDLDMIGVGPYLPDPETPLGRQAADGSLQPAADQVPNSELMTYKVLALTRLMRPMANIPATTALATVNQAAGRETGLARGANVIMPNLTPARYRRLYAIYPAKSCVGEEPHDYDQHVRRTIEAAGRRVGRGRGDSPSYRARRGAGTRPAQV